MAAFQVNFSIKKNSKKNVNEEIAFALINVIQVQIQEPKIMLGTTTTFVFLATLLEPLWRGSLLFTTKFPKIPGPRVINLKRMKGWVDLGATQWFWIWDPWIVNPAP